MDDGAPDWAQDSTPAWALPDAVPKRRRTAIERRLADAVQGVGPEDDVRDLLDPKAREQLVEERQRQAFTEDPDHDILRVLAHEQHRMDAAADIQKQIQGQQTALEQAAVSKNVPWESEQPPEELEAPDVEVRAMRLAPTNDYETMLAPDQIASGEINPDQSGQQAEHQSAADLAALRGSVFGTSGPTDYPASPRPQVTTGIENFFRDKTPMPDSAVVKAPPTIGPQTAPLSPMPTDGYSGGFTGHAFGELGYRAGQIQGAMEQGVENVKQSLIHTGGQWAGAINDLLSDPIAQKYDVNDLSQTAAELVRDANLKILANSPPETDPTGRTIASTTTWAVKNIGSFMGASAAAAAGAGPLFTQVVTWGPTATEMMGDSYDKFRALGYSASQSGGAALAETALMTVPYAMTAAKFEQLAGPLAGRLVAENVIPSLLPPTLQLGTATAAVTFGQFLMQRALVDPDAPISDLISSFVDNAKSFAIAGGIAGAAGLAGAAAMGRVRDSALAGKEMGRGVDETNVPPYTTTAHEFLEGPIWDLPASEYSRVPEPPEGAPHEQQSEVQPSESTELGGAAERNAAGQHGLRDGGESNPTEPWLGQPGQVGSGPREGSVDHEELVDARGRGQQDGAAKLEPELGIAPDWAQPQGQVEPALGTKLEEAAAERGGSNRPEPTLSDRPVALLEPHTEPTLGSREPEQVTHRNDDELKAAGFKRLGSRIVGAPPDVKTWKHVDEQVDDTVRMAEDEGLATPQDWHWYEDAGQSIAKINQSPQELEHTVRIAALISSENPVESNTQDVVRAAHALATGRPVDVGLYQNTNRKRIAALLAAPEMSQDIVGVGPKVLSFYRNIMDGATGKDTYPSDVTVDRHIIRIYFGDGRDSVGQQQYDYIKRVVQLATERYNEKHGTAWLPRQFQARLWSARINEARMRKEGDISPPRPSDTMGRALDRGMAHVPGEVVPSKKLADFDTRATYKQKSDLTTALHGIVNKGGRNLLADALQIPLSHTGFGHGGFEGNVNPNIIASIALATKKGSRNEYDGYPAEQYALAHQYIFRQDAQPWFRPDPKLVDVINRDDVVPGYRLNLEKPLTREQLASFYDALRAGVDPKASFTEINPRTIVIANFHYGDNTKFAELVHSFLEKNDETYGIRSVGRFGSQGAYLEADWEQDPQGLQILGRIAPGRPLLQEQLRAWRGDAERVFAKHAEQLGGGGGRVRDEHAPSGEVVSRETREPEQVMPVPRGTGPQPLNKGAIDVVPPVYYSQLERYITAKGPGKATGEAWWAFIKNSTQSGVKKAELQWNGMDFMLLGHGEADLQSMPRQALGDNSKLIFTKEEVLRDLRMGQLQILPVELGTRLGPEHDAVLNARHKRDIANELMDELKSDIHDRLSQSFEFSGHELAVAISEAARLPMSLLASPTKAYLQPKWVVKQLGAVQLQKLRETYEAATRAEAVYNVEVDTAPRQRMAQFAPEHNPNLSEPGGHNYREVFGTAANGIQVPASHLPAYETKWADGHGSYSFVKNPVFRLRMQDRMVDGEKELDLQEVQPPVKQQFNLMPPELQKIWLPMALKYALVEAARGGYGWLTWTPGSVQAERYSLVKHVDRLVVSRDARGMYAFHGFKNDRGVLGRSDLTKTELAEWIGEDRVKAVMHDFPDEGSSSGVLDGDDIEIGETGLKRLYDEGIPRAINEILKRWGVKAGEFKTFRGGDEFDKRMGIHIDDELREKLEEGLPLFARQDIGAVIDNHIAVTSTPNYGPITQRLRVPINFRSNARRTVSMMSLEKSGTRDVMASALKDLVDAGFPLPAMRVEAFMAHDDTAAWAGGGLFFFDERVISLSHQLMSAAKAGDAEVARAIRGFLAHELIHSLDKDERDYLSSNSPRLEHRFIESKQEWIGGDLFTEMNDLVNNISKPYELRHALKYPIVDIQFGQMSQAIARAEMFAQAGRLWFTNRNALRDHLPKWYDALKEIFNGKRTDAHEVRQGIRSALWPRTAAGSGAELDVRALGSGDQEVPGAGPAEPGLGEVSPNTRGDRVSEVNSRPDEIREYVRKLFGAPVSEGVIGHKKVGGLYRIKYGTIRLKNRNDVNVLAHEVGHRISQANPAIRSVQHSFAQELIPLAQAGYASSPRDLRIEEGFAEWMREYLTDRPRAAQAAPGFSAAFDAFLNANPKLKVPVQELRSRMVAFQALAGEKKILSKVGTMDKSLFATLTEPISGADNWQVFRDKMVYQFLDRWRPIKRMVDTLLPGIEPSKNPYIAFRLLAGNTAMIEDWLTRWTIPFRGADRLSQANYGEPLFDRLKPILADRETGNKWAAYMIAQRSADLISEGRERLFTPSEIAEGLALGNAEFDQVAEKIYDYNDRLLQYRVDAGALDAETAEAFRQYEHYVPFFRMPDGFAQHGGQHGITIYRLKGGTQNLRGVIESIIDNTAKTIHVVNRNHAVQLLADLVEAVPGAGRFAEPVPLEQTAFEVSTKAIIDQLEKQGVTIPPAIAQNLAAMQTFFQVRPQLNERKQTFIYMRDGKYKALQINDPLIWDALNRMEPQEFGWLVNGTAFFARLARAGIVLDPRFMGSNFFRDTMSAWIQSKSNFIPIWSTAKGAVGAFDLKIFGKQIAQMRDSERLYRAFGGGYSDVWHSDSADMTRIMKSMAARGGFDPQYILSPMRILDLLETVGGAVEMGTRLSEFEGVEKKELAAGMDPVDAAVAATFAGREVSTDFATHGANLTLRVLCRATMFMNPSLQGVKKTIDTVSGENGRAAAMKAWLTGSTMALASVLLMLSNRDKDWYKKLENWEKNTYWHFDVGIKDKAGDTIPVRIPKPFEWGLFFATMSESFVNYMVQRAEKNSAQAGSDLRDRLTQGIGMVLGFRVVPNVVNLAIEESFGYNMFTNRKVVPDSQQQLEPELQYNPWTTLTARELGKISGRLGRSVEAAGFDNTGNLLKTSPLQTDFMMRETLGGLSAYLMMASDQVLRLTGDYPPQPETGIFTISRNKGEWPSAHLNEEARWWEVPVIARFFGNPDNPNTKQLTDFYNDLTKVRRAVQSLKQLPDDMQDKYEAQHEGELDRAKEAESVAKELSQKSKQVRDVFEDPDMSGAQKRRELNELSREKRQAVMDYVGGR